MRDLSGDRPAGPFERHAALCAAALKNLADGNPTGAEEAYRQVLAEDPDHVDASRMLAVCLAQRGELVEAMPWIRHAVALNPNSEAAVSSLAIILQAAGHDADALDEFDRAIQLAPGQSVLHLRRGQLLLRAGRFDEALAGFARAVELDPNNALAQFNEGLCLLRLADFAQAWPKLEACLRRPELRLARHYVEPLWLGAENVAAKTVLLYAEQSLPDAIQFCRYAPMLAARGARVILEAPAPLKSLAETLEGVAQLVAPEQPLPDFDLHVPMPALMLAFRTTPDSIPAAVPYLSAQASRIESWAKRLEGGRRRLRVGIGWTSGFAPTQELESLPLDLLGRLPVADVDLISLQPEVPELDRPRMEQLGIREPGIDWVDLSDVAALMMNLDLVITVDGPLAHLAGALGRPAWIMLPFACDWRWLTGRSDSPWYPTVRLFRQPSPRDWQSVVAQVGAAFATQVHHTG